MSARHKARKRALDFLYESDLRNTDLLGLYNSREKGNLSEEGYVLELLEGVNTNRAKIDELIISYAEGWDLDRMPSVDRNILRLALYELLWSKSVPSDVAISEALKLTDENSTEDSTKYVNGVLSRILALKPSLGIN